ncbi:MAG: flagellar hook-basal body protein [Limnochordales bacterium]|nr:flagellar hook-basal body protein [Limnochordales bacterium]
MRGLFTAASGMLLRQLDLDRIANDLANVNTVGYRGQLPANRSFPGALIYRREGGGPGAGPGVGATSPWVSAGTITSQPIGTLGQGVALDGLYFDLQPGRIQETGNPLDIALEDDSFLQVETTAGVLLTRAGNLKIDSTGTLVTAAGEPVLGETGLLRIPPGTSRVEIDADGRVWADGSFVGRLARVQVARPELLEPAGAARYRAGAAAGPLTPVVAGSGGVRSGALEFANVSPITGMVEMIAVTRAYEAASRIIQAYDEQYGRLLNAVVAG